MFAYNPFKPQPSLFTLDSSTFIPLNPHLEHFHNQINNTSFTQNSSASKAPSLPPSATRKQQRKGPAKAASN